MIFSPSKTIPLNSQAVLIVPSFPHIAYYVLHLFSNIYPMFISLSDSNFVQQASIIYVQPNAVSKLSSTLTLSHDPSNLNFPLTRRAALSIPKSTDILDHIHSLPEPAQSQAQTAIRAIETSAMIEQEPQPGLNELIEYLESRQVRMGLCTRNFE